MVLCTEPVNVPVDKAIRAIASTIGRRLIKIVFIVGVLVLVPVGYLLYVGMHGPPYLQIASFVLFGVAFVAFTCLAWRLIRELL